MTCTDEDLLRDILGTPPWADTDQVIRDRFTLERSTGVDAFEPGIGQAGDPTSDFDLGLGEIDGSEILTSTYDDEPGDVDYESLGFDPYAGQELDEDPIDVYDADWHELGGEG
jgi:hypothetical protein